MFSYSRLVTAYWFFDTQVATLATLGAVSGQAHPGPAHVGIGNLAGGAYPNPAHTTPGQPYVSAHPGPAHPCPGMTKVSFLVKCTSSLSPELLH